MQETRCPVIVIANNKGGVGKTTVAVNLAIELSRILLRNGNNAGNVLLIDLDPQGNVNHYLNSGNDAGDKCISNVLLSRPADDKRPYTPAEILAQNLIPMRARGRYPNLVVLPATNKLKTAMEVLIKNEAFAASDWQRENEERISIFDSLSERVIRYARRAFRYVVIDCAPNLGALTPAVYRAGDYVFVPTRPDYLSSQGTISHTEELDRVLGHKDPTKRGRARLKAIIPTMADMRQKLTQVAVQQLEQNYPGLVTTAIPESTRVREASAAHMSVPEYEPGTALAASFMDVVSRAVAL